MKMCWSTEVSIISGLIHLAVGYRAYRKGSIPYIIFTGFYAFMEFFQALQWQFGDLLPGSEFGYLNCSKMNQAFTAVAYILIWIQPYLFTLIASEAAVEDGHQSNITLNKIDQLCGITLATTIWAIVSLMAGLFTEPSYRIPNSNYGLSTCSEIGPYGHIAWRFAPITIKYQPTEFVYLLLSFSAFLLYPRRYYRSIGLGWLFTLILSSMIVGFGPDLPAFWCVTSVLVDGLIIVSLAATN